MDRRQRLPAEPLLSGDPGPGSPAEAALPAHRRQARAEPDRVPARQNVTAARTTVRSALLAVEADDDDMAVLEAELEFEELDEHAVSASAHVPASTDEATVTKCYYPELVI